MRLHLFRKQEAWSPHGSWLDYKNAVYYGGYFSYVSYGEREIFPLYSGCLPSNLVTRSRYYRFLRAFTPFIFRTIRSDRARQRFESVIKSRFPFSKSHRIMSREFYGGAILKKVTRLLNSPAMINFLNLLLSPYINARNYTSGTDLFRSLSTRSLPELMQLFLDTGRFICWLQYNFKPWHPYFEYVDPLIIFLNAIRAHIERWISQYSNDSDELHRILMELSSLTFQGWFGTWARFSVMTFRFFSGFTLDKLRAPRERFSHIPFPSIFDQSLGPRRWYSEVVELVFYGQFFIKISWEFPMNSEYFITFDHLGNFSIEFDEYRYVDHAEDIVKAIRGDVDLHIGSVDGPEKIPDYMKWWLPRERPHWWRKKRTRPIRWYRDYIKEDRKYIVRGGKIYPLILPDEYFK